MSTSADNVQIELIKIVTHSQLLHNLVPDVRVRALTQSLAHCESYENAVSLLLENLSESPYIPIEKRNPLAELTMTRNFEALRQAVHCDPILPRPPDNHSARQESFHAFREMVVAIFSRSRKMAALPAVRRRHIGAAIHAQRTIEDIKMLALSALETSQAFDSNARYMVANDIFDNRYDRLLLPDRFDCDEIPRMHHSPSAKTNGTAEQPIDNEVIVHECPVCLGSSPTTIRLPCGHVFCRSCIVAWTERSQECPMCREIFEIHPSWSADAS